MSFYRVADTEAQKLSIWILGGNKFSFTVYFALRIIGVWFLYGGYCGVTNKVIAYKCDVFLLLFELESQFDNIFGQLNQRRQIE